MVGGGAVQVGIMSKVQEAFGGAPKFTVLNQFGANATPSSRRRLQRVDEKRREVDKTFRLTRLPRMFSL